MSELIQKNDNRATIRWKLLTSASALAFTVSSIGVARAEDADHPLIWIELGGQMENISGQGESFTPTFFSVYPTSTILQQKVTPQQAQQPPRFAFGEDGKISFQPESSDWVFSAGVRIGRSSTVRHVDHQTRNVHHPKYISGVPYTQVYPTLAKPIFTQEKFIDSHISQKESHAVLDFSAGKDVGLGLFGKDSSSTLSLGVRIAQFSSRSSDDIRARPDLHFKYYLFGNEGLNLGAYFHTYHATINASRRFRGVGPSVSWTGSAPFVGNQQDGELTFDWGANAALLFGKQKARVRHQQTGRYWPLAAAFGGYQYVQQLTPISGGHSTNRSVTVPNAGGSVGLSWRVQDFKVSMGYRADFFFGAMDVGIDARKNGTLGFKGPYASISVGLGD